MVSRYNRSVTDRLLQGAKEEYVRRGGTEWSLTVFDAPGTYELPAIAGAVSRSTAWRGVVCLGCVIRGETSHDEVIAHAVANALAHLATRSGVPVGFGVITAQSVAHAMARAGGDKGNRGTDAMAAVLDTFAVLRSIRQASGGAMPQPGLGRAPHDKAAGEG